MEANFAHQYQRQQAVKVQHGRLLGRAAVAGGNGHVAVQKHGGREVRLAQLDSACGRCRGGAAHCAALVLL